MFIVYWRLKAMQKFSYHTHTNTFGICDGRNSATEMVQKATEIGYTEIGISNHFMYHPNIIGSSLMYFQDEKKALDFCKRMIETLREETKDAKIKVKIGFEVDFFESSAWRKVFESIVSKLEVDYLIGSTHMLINKDESMIVSLYEFRDKSTLPLDDIMSIYWQRLCRAIESGYFSFMTHLDLPKLWNICAEDCWLPHKEKVVEALIKYKQPYELNTSGWTKCGEQHPALWMLEELNKHDVPVVISDDAHSIGMLAQHFDKAEALLSSINYRKRFKI